MGYSNIGTDSGKCQNELLEYVNSNSNDYNEIFENYDKKNYDKLKKNFTHFCSCLKAAKNLNDDKISKQIKEQSELFYKIGKCKSLSKHQKVCVLSMNVYLSFLCNCNSKKNNVREACNLESTSSKSNLSSCTDNFTEKSVCALDKSSSSSSSKASSKCSSNEIKHKPKKDNSKPCKPCNKKDNDSCSSSSDNKKSNQCPPLNCCTDEPYPFKEAEMCSRTGGYYDECGLGDCNDIEQLQKITNRLKVVLKQLCMLSAIFCQMQQQCVEKMNYFAVCDTECYVDCVSIDSQNKLTYLLYKQVNALITQNNCVFNGTKDTQPIKVYLNCGKSLTVCIIDNIKFTFVQDCKCSYILVNIGSKQYKLWFIKDGITNSEAICVLKENCNTINMILHALSSNKKMIEHWLNIACKMAKCKEICDMKCEKQVSSCAW
jgi:hypothetical protein